MKFFKAISALFTLRQARKISTANAKKSPVQRSLDVAFGKYLLLTNTVSSGVLMFVGDLIQQEIEYQQKKLPARYDYGRLGRMLIVGIGMGPMHHYYYINLNKILPKRDLTTVTQKILLDQFVMSPICIGYFFYGIGYLEGKSTSKCTEELKKKFIEVYKMDWCVWPPTQFINFYFLPEAYQVLYINAMTMIYNIFLSYIKHRELAEKNKILSVREVEEKAL